MSFDTLEKHYISDQIFDVLKREILEQRIVVGEKLPSEGKLSAQFGVSKASVKTALQRLSTLGLIETRVGQGSFVIEFDPQQCFDQLHDFIMSESEIAEIIEYRMYIEMAATKLAVKKAAKENFKRMEEILCEMEKARKKNNLELHGQMDYLFHLEIWKATQNSIFEMAYKIIGKTLIRHITILNKEFIKKDKGYMLRKDDIHRRLLDAIKNKDIELCRDCYRTMFSIREQISSAQYKDC